MLLKVMESFISNMCDVCFSGFCYLIVLCVSYG